MTLSSNPYRSKKSLNLMPSYSKAKHASMYDNKKLNNVITARALRSYLSDDHGKALVVPF